jgi:hypothetical protein
MGEMFITGFAMNVQFDLWKTLSNALLAAFITYTDMSPMTCQYDANTVKSIDEDAFHLSHKLVGSKSLVSGVRVCSME